MKQEPPGGQSWRTNCLRRYEFIVFWKEKGIRKRQCHFLHPMIYTPRTENVDKHKKNPVDLVQILQRWQHLYSNL